MGRKKLFSAVLSAAMIITTLPASADMVNMSTSGGYVKSTYDKSKNEGAWTGANTDMWGYRISVYWAKQGEVRDNGDGTYTPEYLWDGEKGEDWTQVGNNVDLRREYITDEKGEYFFPAFWGDNIYKYVVESNKIHERALIFQHTVDNYNYAVINDSLVTQEVIDSDMEQLTNSFSDEAQEYAALGAHDFADAFSRLTDMNKDGSGVILTSEDMGLPYMKLMNSKDYESVEYLKSYLIHPTILNLISNYTGGGWDFTSFYEGKRNDVNGQYKIYVEPLMARMYNGTFGVLSWKDFVEEYFEASGSGSTSATAIENLADANKQLSGSLSLQAGEPILKFANGRYMGDLLEAGWFEKTDLSGVDADSIPKYIDYDQCGGNYLGIGVVTSPSTASYAQLLQKKKTAVYVRYWDAEANEMLYEQGCG